MMTARPSLERAILNTDGGSRGNPGMSGIGFTLKVDDGRGLETICRGGAFIGVATNNIAEYRALIWGLENARVLRVRKIDVCLDSELIVKQLRGEYRVKNEGIKPLYAEAKQLLGGFETCTIKHVMREYNAAADELANAAMDSRGMVGDYAIGYDTGDLFSATTSEVIPETTPEVTPATTPVAVLPQQTEPDDSCTKRSTMSSDSGIYILTIKEHFDAAHALVGYPGQCKNLHGHTWDVEISVQGTELDEVGIVYDFARLKADLLGILENYDHAYLNKVPPFDVINATAENLARVIYDQMVELLPKNVTMVEVAVWESPIAKLVYRR